MSSFHAVFEVLAEEKKPKQRRAKQVQMFLPQNSGCLFPSEQEENEIFYDPEKEEIIKKAFEDHTELFAFFSYICREKKDPPTIEYQGRVFQQKSNYCFVYHQDYERLTGETGAKKIYGSKYIKVNPARIGNLHFQFQGIRINLITGRIDDIDNAKPTPRYKELTR